MSSYKVIGLMSGTSLDGVDMAACEFIFENNFWSYKIHHCRTHPYENDWKARLANLQNASALEFALTNTEYGHYLGKLAGDFIRDSEFMPDFIASHGHTIFHQPDKGLTVQIGSGSAIAAETGFPVVCDFRSLDVALNGQGAPLVPIGDRILFSEYDACLNLGGFANISLEMDHKRIAYDICPVNIVLNKLAGQLGLNYDPDGLFASKGTVNLKLLSSLNELPYYFKIHPKSLGREWLENEFLPIFEDYQLPVEDLLATVYEHIAIQISRSMESKPDSKVLVTGGGSKNKFLMAKIGDKGNNTWIVPEEELSDFKEALIFAFLAVLRWRNENNILKSVTGSVKDQKGGAIYLI